MRMDLASTFECDRLLKVLIARYGIAANALMSDAILSSTIPRKERIWAGWC